MAMKKIKKSRDSYIQKLAGAKPRSSIKPVIISQFVDLHPFGVAGRLHLQRHHPAEGEGGGASTGDNSGTSAPERGSHRIIPEASQDPTATWPRGEMMQR